MGKGQRVRANRVAEKESKKEIIVKSTKKQRRNKVFGSIVAGIVCLCLLGGILYHTVYNSAYNRGVIQRKTTVLQTENYTVDAAMMSYFFYLQYNNFANTYSSNLANFGLNTSVSLRQQDSIFESGSTWFEYFCDQASTQVKDMLYLAEMAVSEGMALDETDQKKITTAIDNYKDVAEEAGYDAKTFFSLVFGNGVNENDIRKCMEISALAEKYQENYMDTLVYTDAEIDQYYADNVNSHRYVNYLSYAVEAEDIDDSTTYAAAKEKAEALAAVKNKEAYAAWVEKDVRSTRTVSEDYSAEDLEADVEEIVTNLEVKKAKYSKDSDLSKWLFEEAKVGDARIEDDEAGTYTVYYLTATPYRNEAATKNIRQLIFLTESYDDEAAAKTEAETVFQTLKDEGLTEDAFTTYAAQYSADDATAGIGGLCENYEKDSFDAAVAEWAFNDARNAGDLELVTMTDGYAICYYIGEGKVAWKAECISAKQNEDYTAAYEEWTEKITLTENESGYNVIPDNV
ncbi:MAG: peptidylprolyl isomerase [Clostridia bacterium]|nr:peptidylprolyl isomerase [Clostridia bacterium]